MDENAQLSMFDVRAAAKRHLLCVVNGEERQLPVSEIFDAERYDSLTAVTYSASPEFISRYLSGFRKLDIIVGIQETGVQVRASQAIAAFAANDAFSQAIADGITLKPLDFYRELSEEAQNRFADRDYRVEVSTVSSIHAKIYLLENNSTGENRLIYGSANLSLQAFEENYPQYEFIEIEDNSPKFDIYKKWINEDIRPDLISYIPEAVIRTVRQKKGLSPVDRDELKQKITVGIIDETIKGAEGQGLSPGLCDRIYDVKNLSEAALKEEREQLKTAETIYKLRREIVKPPTAKAPAAFKTMNTIRQHVEKIITVSVAKPNEQALKRPFFADSEKDRFVDADGAVHSGLFVSDGTSDDLAPLGRVATPEKIKASLTAIHHLMQSYEEFAHDYTVDYGKTIFEAILYAFTAPFLWEIRARISRGNISEASDIPNFLIIGAGQGGSGKTFLLSVLNILLTGREDGIILFNQMARPGKINDNANVRDMINSIMSEENCFPLLIDEVPIDFFQNASYASNLIKQISNQRAMNQGAPCPVMICTTNSVDGKNIAGFSIGSAESRRSYYLLIDRMIERDTEEHNRFYIESLKNNLHNTLFRDFVIRMAARLLDDDQAWKLTDANHRVDFLAVTRDIFRQYYNEADMPLPQYFSDCLADDLNESNRIKWSRLFRAERNKGMSGNNSYDPDRNTIIFDTHFLNDAHGYKDDMIEAEYRKAIPAEVAFGGSEGTAGRQIELKADAFFDWIGEKNPYKSAKYRLFKKL